MIVICTLILAIHSIFQPYKLKRVNVVETLYLHILCIMAIMQVLQKSDVANFVCSLLLMSTTAHALALTLFKAVTFFQKRYKKSCPTRCIHRRDYGSIKQTTDVEESLTFEQKQRKHIFDIIFSKSDDYSFPFWWLFWWIIECYRSALFLRHSKPVCHHGCTLWISDSSGWFPDLTGITDSKKLFPDFKAPDYGNYRHIFFFWISKLRSACMRRNTRGRH